MDKFITDTEKVIADRFYVFLKKWCPSWKHLIDTDENDGEEFRQFLKSKLQEQENLIKQQLIEKIEAEIEKIDNMDGRETTGKAWSKRSLNGVINIIKEN